MLGDSSHILQASAHSNIILAKLHNISKGYIVRLRVRLHPKRVGSKLTLPMTHIKSLSSQFKAKLILFLELI